MFESPHARFVLSVLLAFPLAGLLAPPDVFTQLFVLAGLLVAAYVLSYRGGYDALFGN